MEIVSGIHSTPAGATSSLGAGPPNVYLAVGNRAAAFIDSGYSHQDEAQARLDYLSTLGGPPIEAILLTHRHPDHIGGAAHFHKATGAEIVSSSVERPFVDSGLENLGEPVRVHRAMGDGETLDLGDLTLECVSAPGHTMGSMALYAREPRALFTGDTVLGGVVTPIVSPSDGDMASYLQTLGRFLDYDLAFICPGHGPVVEDPQRRVKAVIEHRLKREEEILSAIRNGRRTLDQLLEGIYVGLDSRLLGAARRQIQCHLIKLEREGRVGVRGDEYVLIA